MRGLPSRAWPRISPNQRAEWTSSVLGHVPHSHSSDFSPGPRRLNRSDVGPWFQENSPLLRELKLGAKVSDDPRKFDALADNPPAPASSDLSDPTFGPVPSGSISPRAVRSPASSPVGQRAAAEESEDAIHDLTAAKPMGLRGRSASSKLARYLTVTVRFRPATLARESAVAGSGAPCGGLSNANRRCEPAIR